LLDDQVQLTQCRTKQPVQVRPSDSGFNNYKDEESKRLLFINYNNFFLELSEMQNFFSQIKPFSPNYFNFKVLDEKENQVFKKLKTLLRTYITNSKAYWEINTLL
jgi:hypothetical protein